MFLGDKEFTSYHNTQIDMFLEINVDNEVCPTVVWEALKSIHERVYHVLLFTLEKLDQ
jgi:hypothetical protein